MKWEGHGQTHIGRVRKTNQDAYRIHPELDLWVVADGMGGHAGGEVASQLAVNSIGPYFDQQQLKWSPLNIDERESVLRKALEVTNQNIKDHASQHPEYSGMGTTAVVLSISSDQATIAHVGDSRAYIINESGISQLMRDHTLVEERIELGLLTREEALTHPLRNVLTRGLGIESSVQPSVQTHSLQPTDTILLCSDGLTKMLSDNEIFEVFRQYQNSLQGACHALVETANRLGGEDNITVILVGAEK